MMTVFPIIHFQHEYEDIVKWYDDLAKQYPTILTYVESIGKSVEGRDQPAVHITGSKDPNRMRIYFQCQIHASMYTFIPCMHIEWL